MSMLKKLLFTAIFVVATLTIPGVILLLTVDAANDFGVYVIVYGVILFAVFGYIIVSMHSLSKEIHNALEEMKMQNAAIAYKLTNTTVPVAEAVFEPQEEKKEEPVKDTSNVKLNPAEPLTIDGKVVSSETFGDFE